MSINPSITVKFKMGSISKTGIVCNFQKRNDFVRLITSIIIGLVALVPGALLAKAPPVVILEITSRTPAFDGAAFGEAGSYERLVGVARLAVDPKAPENRGIVDLDIAPRAADGLVHYDVDVEILRPRDPLKARRVLLYEVVNRGMKLLSYSRDGGPGDIVAALRRGYTVVWSGWQGDIVGPALIGARLPVALGADGPITGRVVAETIFDDVSSNVIKLAYPAADVKAGGSLAVRESADGPDRLIPAADWQYRNDREVVVRRPTDTDGGAIYRFSYVARDPKVMGLGFAGIRDIVSFLRHGGAAQGNPLYDIATAPCERTARGICANPQGGVFSSAVGVGISQSGRFLRDYLWQGFNRDLQGGRVFDGLIPVVAGARRTFTNFRFSEPGRFSRQHEEHETPGFTFPFAYQTIRDVVTGKSDGLLARCSADRTCPKVFQIDTSTEFWQGGSSLVGTGGAERDLPFPADVRAFFIASGSHAPGVVMPACEMAANPLNHSAVVNALLIDMVEWTTAQRNPPPSRWPRLADRELVSPDKLVAPDLSSIERVWPTVFNRPAAPPGTQGWPVLLPTVDSDGNDRGGIRLPALVAPAGTYLGWNLRKVGYATGQLCSVLGGFIPFAVDETARGRDPRQSIAARYSGEHRAVIMQAAEQILKKERLLLSD